LVRRLSGFALAAQLRLQRTHLTVQRGLVAPQLRLRHLQPGPARLLLLLEPSQIFCRDLFLIPKQLGLGFDETNQQLRLQF
jgi:hypothetical protein